MKPAILVRCYINSWSANKLDRGASNDVQSRTQSKTAIVVKRLFGKDSLYDQLIAKQNSVRNMFNELTAPWDDKSWRIVSAGGFSPFLDKVRKEAYAHDELACKFYESYPSMVQEDAIRQGTLYNPQDYPALEDIKGRFKVSLFFRPVPQEGDFRVEMDPDTLEELKQSFREDTDERIKTAVGDSYSRIKSALEHLKDKLDSYGPGKRLFESTITNLLEIADALPGLNISDDPQLEQLANEIRQNFEDQDMDALRDDPTKREDVSKRATSLLDVISTLQRPEQPMETVEATINYTPDEQAVLTDKEREILKRLGQ